MKTPVVVVCGWDGPVDETAAALLGPGSVLVHHDLTHVREGVVRRTTSTVDSTREHILELAHGCVSCTLRYDLMPLLRSLSQRSSVSSIVLRLDPELEPEAVCWAIENLIVAGVNGRVDAPAGFDVEVVTVIACLDFETWLVNATGDDALDDDRTIAQIVVGQAESADIIVATDSGAAGWEKAKTTAVFDRLAPGAIICRDSLPDLPLMHRARRPPFDAHSPLLQGQPPLTADCGVSVFEFTAARPFHPERLHEAIDTLLEGVVSSRGRLWVATQPDDALWLESAGGGLRVASAGRWLAAMTPVEQQRQSTTRRALAALRWDDVYGDRDSSIVAIVHDADPDEIRRALTWALVTDDEFADPDLWATWPDPFGEFHEDPCETTVVPLVERKARE